jgi:hypothetical protein
MDRDSSSCVWRPRMLRRIKHNLTYANVVSSLALFLVLSGGTAFALTGSNTVFSDDIVDGDVTSDDIGSNAVKFPELDSTAVTGSKVRDGTLFGADVGNDSLTGSDIVESTLAGVVKDCGLGAVEGALRVHGSASMSATYVRTGGVAFGAFTCRGLMRVRRVSAGIYHVCFGNLNNAASVAVASASDSQENYATAEFFSFGFDDCDAANTAIDVVYEVRVLSDAGVPTDGKFTLVLS